MTDALPASVIFGVPAKIAKGVAVPRSTVDWAAYTADPAAATSTKTEPMNASMKLFTFMPTILSISVQLLLFNNLNVTVHQIQPGIKVVD
jgi:hypothetical protein